MAVYYVGLNTSVVDGSTYTANDTIIIKSGKRGNLTFKKFNGNGNYITITNEKTTPSTKVENTGVLQLDDCKYVDLRGDGDTGLEYGIKVINNGSAVTVNTVRVMGKSDHIKISYLEMAFDGNTNLAGIGILVHEANESIDWILDGIHIHHNYIHDARYAGMYLGQNRLGVNAPWIANVSVHDNIIDDSGAYGMCLKGVDASSGICYIYNNTIRVTGLVYTSDDQKNPGISCHSFYGSTAYAKIYNNRIENTVGVGIRVGKARHQVYNNEVLGCGTGNDERWGHGIIAYDRADNTNIYDNIIIRPTRYGIYALSGASSNGTTISRNLIGDAGLGEWSEEKSGKIIESSGVDANIYHANVADFGFNTWSDDGDYSNDDFTIGNSCEGVVCDNICIGADLYSQKCVDGYCVTDQVLESNSESCGHDPCDGVTCENVCIGADLYSQKCVGGVCVPDQLLESNSTTCDHNPCEGVVCENICIGDDLWSQICDPDTGNCVPNQLLQPDSINCKIPDHVPSDESTIKTYIILGGLGIMGLAILLLKK